MFLESTDPKAHQLLGDYRLAVATCLRMIPKSGLLGFGPGTWSATYPHFTNDTFLRTFYLNLQFAHNDYLQAVVEWGVLGAAAWAFLILGAMDVTVRRLCKNRANNLEVTREEAISIGCALALFGVLLHALLDFPLQIPSIQLYVCVLVGLLWASRLRVAAVKPPAIEHEN
jgi:O-antigen ligase